MHKNYIIKVDVPDFTIKEVLQAPSDLDECLDMSAKLNKENKDSDTKYLAMPHMTAEPVVGKRASDELVRLAEDRKPITSERVQEHIAELDMTIKCAMAIEATIRGTGVVPLKNISVEDAIHSINMTCAIIYAIREMHKMHLEQKEEVKDSIDALKALLGIKFSEDK